MKKKIFFYLFLVCAGKMPAIMHAQQNEHATVNEPDQHENVQEIDQVHEELGNVDEEQVTVLADEEIVGYDGLDHAFEACEAQPKPRFTMPEWIVSLGIALAIKYLEVQEFVGEKWQRLKELLRKKRTHGTTIKA